MSFFDQYKSEIKQTLGQDQEVFFFWKGRVALYAILRALEIQKNDEVILPALTCVVVPNAIMYLGGKPVYVDVEPETFNIDSSRIEEKITSRTRVVLAQNTFGLSSDLDKIIAVARKHSLWVIEDCAHGYGGTYKKRPNGTVADAAFFSTQWNKTFSTGIGGFAVTRNKKLTAKLQSLSNEAMEPAVSEKVSLSVQILANSLFLNQTTYWAALGAYRWLTKKNFVTGSSAGSELESPVMPAGFFKKAADVQAREGLKQLRGLKQNLSHRKMIARQYKHIFTNIGVSPLLEPDYADHTFIKFPLLVKDRPTFLRKAEKQKIELGDWFVSPIHPIKANLNKWAYVNGENPLAEALSRSLVNLPTHIKIDEKYIERIEAFLHKNMSDVFFSVQECISWQKKVGLYAE